MLKTLFRFALCCIGIGAFAQENSDSRPVCNWPGPAERVRLRTGSDTTRTTAKLAGGYVLSITQGQDPEEVEKACEATIVDSKEEAVYETAGYSVELTVPTGEDLDGDGHPEVVLLVDKGGGFHCCLGYEVISFYPSVHKIEGERLPAVAGRMGFAKDEKGRWILKVIDVLEGWNSMAARPGAARIFRFQDGKSIDFTPEYCGSMIDLNDLNGLSFEEIDRFRRGALLPLDTEIFESRVESEALQFAFCRKSRESLEAFGIWPEHDRKKVREEFVKSFTEQYPELSDQFKKEQK